MHVYEQFRHYLCYPTNSKSRRHGKLLIALILILIITFTFTYYSSAPVRSSSFILEKNQPVKDRQSVNSEVLLLYVYAASHSHAYGNLKYFIENTVAENDRVDYYFILQKIDDKEIDLEKMPQLKSKNAHYIQHENKCFDVGTYGWFFDQFTIGNPWKTETKASTSSDVKLDIRKYKYFIFLNSSVRGPFFPPYYLQALSRKDHYSLYWYSAFTNSINDQFKLVGCTISCQNVPHVQSYFFVVDFIALKLLLKPESNDGSSHNGAFHCFATKHDAIQNNEILSSSRIFNAGYHIHSMMTEYQKWNFTSEHDRSCNNGHNPYQDKNYHGTSLEPYEVVFVKYNDVTLLSEAKRRAQTYQDWVEANRLKN